MYDDAAILKAINSALDELDITPAMFAEAERHYKAIANYLCNNGIEADISTYGSIATGTVVRPYTLDKNSYFDFDVMCKRSDLSKNATTPGNVRGPVEDALTGSDRYADMLDLCDECITVEYALNDRKDGFRLDLNPCVSNAGDEPGISQCETYPDYAEKTISIARANSNDWLESNPDGLTAWFADKNERFAKRSREAQRRTIFAKNTAIYASIEEVPRSLERSPLQRAVQFAKRSRDVFYFGDNTNTPPSSCILLVLMTRAAEGLPDDATTVDIVRAFLASAGIGQKGAHSDLTSSIGANGGWNLDNPVYAGSLIVEGWTESDSQALARWLRALASDLHELTMGGNKSEAVARSLFGKGPASTAALKALTGTEEHAVPGVISSGHKPWGSAA